MADRSVSVRLKGDISDFNRAMLAGAASAKVFTKSLDTSTDRMGNLVQTSLALGPALVPIGAAAIPAISGLANQLAFAAAGAGVAALAFSGVGDALDAVNDYSLEPTTANFEKMQQTLATLGPEGQHFVRFLQDLRPEMQQLQNVAQAGLFPGVEAGLTDLMDLLPQAERIISEVATTLGDLVAEAGDNLNDARWQEFFDFLENEARPTLLDMGRTLGNFAEGFANLWMAFDPLSDQFSNSFLQMSRDFAEWTDGLAQTEGFQEFLDYVAKSGPLAWDALTSIGNALVQIVEAAAPVGTAVLPVITALADAFAAIAGSPAGPVLIGAAAGISALSRAVAIYKVANGAALISLMDKLGGKGAVFRAAAAGAGVFALSMTDLDEKMGLGNTATLAMMGLIAGPWGAAVGAGVGLAMDFAASNDAVWQALDRASAAMGTAGASVAELNTAYDTAAQTVADFKASVDDVSLTNFASLKNSFEDAFGRSDVEEMEAALADLKVSRDEAIAKAQEQAFAEAGLSSEMRNASQSTRDQTQALLDNIAAHNALADELLASLNAEIAYEQAIDDATAAARKAKDGLDLNTQAGRENMTVLSQLAGRWNALTPAQQNAAGGAERAREVFIRVARQMGATAAEARILADRYLDIPTKVDTDIKADDQASGKIKTVAQLMQSLDGDRATVTIVTRRITEHLDRFLGSLPGQRRADGGYISGPGGPRDDKVPAMLSNGEFVVNAAATKRHLPELHQMNAQKFATGGPVLSRLANGGFPSTGGNDGAGAPVQLVQNVYPQPEQSPQEIGRQSANQLLWSLSLT